MISMPTFIRTIMQIEVTSTPRFFIPLTLEQVNVLMKMSAMHYDSKCRGASAAGLSWDRQGFILGWKNHITSYIDHPNDDGSTLPIEASWSQLDTCLKIMECPIRLNVTELSIRACLTYDFCKILESTRPYLDQWKTKIDTNEEGNPHEPL